MSFDLYKDNLNDVSDADLFAAVEEFTGVSLHQPERTQENYLLDFKESWSDSALRTVAAFANTFGGLLIIGVSETGGRADQIVGVATQRHDIKTGIASSIASNISPTPPYEIRDVAFPNGTLKHLCLVRVRKGTGLYLLTKKNEQPVYVRNEDESRPADAARLQALIATRISTGFSGYAPVADPVGFYVSQLNVAGPSGQRGRSETFLQLQITPEEPQTARLDLAVEDQLKGIIRGIYPGFSEAVFSEVRSRYWYQITYLDEFADYEMRWGITEGGTLHFITQIRTTVQKGTEHTAAWSLSDLMTNLDCTIETAHQLWDFLEYTGEGRVFASLQVEGLPLLERSSGLDTALAFGHYEKDGPRRRARPLSSGALTRAVVQGNRANAVADITYASRTGSHAEPVALLANQLLRDLGHATRLPDLRKLL